MPRAAASSRNTFRHGLTAWQWRTEGFALLPGWKASGRLLNGQKKNANTTCQLGPSERSKISGKSTLCRFNSMGVKGGKLLEGQLGRGPFARLETPIEEGSKASQKGFKGQPKGSRTHRQLGDRTLRHALTAWQWRMEGYVPLPGRKASGRLLNA